MENGTEKINRILTNLTSTQEDMLALKDYIWQNLDHSSVKEVQTAASFQVKYLELLDQFAQNSQEIAALISQFTGIKVEDSPKEVEQSNSENQRIIKELNKDTPHKITEDFTFKRPTAFIFDGYAYPDMNCWSQLYVQFVACLGKKDLAKLKSLADNPDFISKQNKKYYSASAKVLRKPCKVFEGFYVETNRSANDLMKLAIDLLNYFEIPFEVPESWCWCRWGELSYSIQYGYNAPAKETGRIKMVRITDIQNGKVQWDTVPFCDISDSDINVYHLRKNDILFARTGGTVGKSFLVDEESENALFAGYLIRTQYNDKKLNPRYMKMFMESQLYWDQLKNGTIATAQPNCNGQTLLKMILPLPPLEEQNEIVNKLEELIPLFINK